MVDAAQLTIDTNATALQMAETILGDGIQIVANSVSYSGDAASSGIYSGGLATSPGFVPSDTGVILSTGLAQSVTNATGEANQTDFTSTDSVNGIDGDLDFNAAAGQATFDAAFIEASFIPDGDTLTLQFVFGSEEYPEFVNSGFNDTIGVWVNGQALELSVGAAGETSVDAVNAGSNANLFVDNTLSPFNTEMDGFTITLTMKATVTPGAVNTLKIGIADAGDATYDSNILIAANSIQSAVIAQDDSATVSPNNEVTIDLLDNDSGQGTLQITHINGQQVSANDSVLLPSGETVILNEDGTVTVESDGDSGVNTFAYTIANENGVSDSAVVTLTTAVPCFTPGALITTKDGEVPVEDLQPGDLVLTVDNGYQPVRWVCKRSLTQVDLAKHNNLRPIVIRKNAFGNRRKMLVSPQHGLIVERNGQETLMRAKHAAETLGGKYARVDKRCERVTYIHLLFDQHEIIFAEGAKTESFFPGPVALKSLDEPVLGELLFLFPELSSVVFDDECPKSRYGSHARPYLLRKEVRKMRPSFFPVQHA